MSRYDPMVNEVRDLRDAEGIGIIEAKEIATRRRLVKHVFELRAQPERPATNHELADLLAMFARNYREDQSCGPRRV
jgi:hypothetical protein